MEIQVPESKAHSFKYIVFQLRTNYTEILKPEDEQVLKIATFSVGKSKG